MNVVLHQLSFRLIVGVEYRVAYQPQKLDTVAQAWLRVVQKLPDAAFISGFKWIQIHGDLA